MKTRSAKNKGKLLQNLVRTKILDMFPKLTARDVKSTTMGETGADIQLSEMGFSVFPYNVECKSLAKVAIYKHYEQAKSHGEGEPLLVIKQNGDKPLAVVDLEHFLMLTRWERVN